MHAHIYTHRHTRTNTRSVSFSLSLSLSHIHNMQYSSFMSQLKHAVLHTHSHAHTHSRAQICTHAHTQTRTAQTHTHTHRYTHTLTHKHKCKHEHALFPTRKQIQQCSLVALQHSPDCVLHNATSSYSPLGVGSFARQCLRMLSVCLRMWPNYMCDMTQACA